MTLPPPLTVAESNAGQLIAWDGGQGAFWTERADRFDAGAARYLPHLLDAAELEASSCVLDVGCGSGALARGAARCAPAGTTVGVDLSSQQLDLARRRTRQEGLRNVSFVQADAQVHWFAPRSVDVVLSRHGSMFFGDPAAAFANLTRTLRPGARMVLLTWQPLADNEWIRTFRAILGAGRDLPQPSSTAPGAFSMSEPHRVHRLLESVGLVDVQLTGVREPMFYGDDVDDACGFLEQHFAGLTADLDDLARARALGELRADLAAHLTDDGVHYDSAACLVRARRP